MLATSTSARRTPIAQAVQGALPADDLTLIGRHLDVPFTEIAFDWDDKVMLSETAIAPGNLYGLANAVTAGAPPAKHREVRHGDCVLLSDIWLTDATENPTSLDGPLIQADSELIGINVEILWEAQHIGFAVPVGHMFLTERHLPSDAKHNRFRLAIIERGSCLEVAAIDIQKVAARADLGVGDRLTSVDGRGFGTLFDLHRRLLRIEPDYRLTFDTERDGSPVLVEFTTIATPQPDGGPQVSRLLDMNLNEQSHDDPIQAGLLIISMRADGLAGRAGLRDDVRILRIEGQAARKNNGGGAGLAVLLPRTGIEFSVAIFGLRGGVLLAKTQTVPGTLN